MHERNERSGRREGEERKRIEGENGIKKETD